MANGREYYVLENKKWWKLFKPQRMYISLNMHPTKFKRKPFKKFKTTPHTTNKTLIFWYFPDYSEQGGSKLNSSISFQGHVHGY